MNGTLRPHPAHVPTLTEVIEVQGQTPAVQPAKPPLPLDALPVLGEVVSTQATEQLPPSPQPLMPTAVTAAPQDAPSTVTEAQLAHRVLSDVQKQIDGMLEFRLKEAMAPLLARHTEAIARDLRDELNRTLKDVVARSVAQELAKLRQR